MTKKRTHKKVVKTVHEVDGSTKTTIQELPNEASPKKQESSHKTHYSHEKKMTAKEREELLIENFVGIQHAMTNLSIKFGTLSDNITKLLQVFEEAAKNMISGTTNPHDNADMLNKIDSLLDQNKTIAKGLVLMEGKLRGRSEVVDHSHMHPAEQIPSRGEYSESQAHAPSPAPSPAPEYSKKRQPLPRI